MPVCRRQIGERAGIVLIQRFLEPDQVAILDRPAQQARFDRVELVVGIHHELDVRPDRLAHQAHPRRILLPALFVHADHHLQPVVAILHLHFGGLHQLLAVVFVEAERASVSTSQDTILRLNGFASNGTGTEK
jgi:hypothetical protein